MKVFFAMLFVASAITASTIAATPGPVVLDRVHSVYNGELAVLDHQGERFLISQSRQGGVLDSAMDLTHKERLVLGNLQLMALLAGLHPQPNSVYNLGLGGGDLVRFYLHEYEKGHADSAEIDPSVVSVAMKYFDITNPRHRVFEGEGFDILQHQTSKYDIIWVDDLLSKKGPKAFVPANQLKTLHERLTEGGMLVANLGEARSATYFSEVEQGYHRGFSHAIRIKSPFFKTNELFGLLSESAFPGQAKTAPAMMPAYLIAVGNQNSLTCAHFWELYHKWMSEKKISVEWDQTGKDKKLNTNELCQDL